MRLRSDTALLGTLLCALSAAISSCGDDSAGKPQPLPALSVAATASAAPVQPSVSVEAKLESLLLATAGCGGAPLEQATLPPIISNDDSRCPAELDFERQAAELAVGDELSRERHAPAAQVCARHLAHEKARVRRAAARCLAEHEDGIDDAKKALDALIDQAMVEPDGGIASALFEAVRALDPTRHGLTERLVAVLKKRAADDHAAAPEHLGPEQRTRYYAHQSKTNREAVDTGVLALVPRSQEHAPSREAVDYALELARAGRGSRGVIEVIGLSDLEVDVACEAYVSIASSKDPGWFSGFDGAAGTRGLCKKRSTAFVDAIVARLGGDIEGSKVPAEATRTLATLIQSGFFDDAARARMNAAGAATPNHDRARKFGAISMLIQ